MIVVLDRPDQMRQNETRHDLTRIDSTKLDESRTFCLLQVSKAARQEKKFQDYNERCTFHHQAKVDPHQILRLAYPLPSTP